VTTTVRDNPTRHRFEVCVDDHLAGFTEYRLSPRRIAFTHTEIDEAFSGRGLARKLVVEELEEARRRGLAVLPICPYVRDVIARNADTYLDLVPAGARNQFELPAAPPPSG
jgi:predicted GNAT family acetyltransferase